MRFWRKSGSERFERGVQDKIIKETKRELSCIKDRVERVLILLGKQTKAETDAGSLESARDHKRTHDQGYNWLRSAKRRNLASTESRRSTDECSSQSRRNTRQQHTALCLPDGKFANSE